MTLDSVITIIDSLRQKLEEAVSGKKKAEKERDDCEASGRFFRGMIKEKEDEVNGLYKRLSTDVSLISGSRFRREYMKEVREILYGPQMKKAFDELQKGASLSYEGYRAAEKTVDYLRGEIRKLENEIHEAEILKRSLYEALSEKK